MLASAASGYRVTLTEPEVIAGSALKPGDYRITVSGDKATLKMGRTSLEVPVKVESGSEKFAITAIESQSEGGKNVVDEIRVGGTTTTLVFNR